MRAIENGRWVVQVAPTGFTAIVDDRGNVLDRTSISEAAVLQREVGLREGLTIYTRWGNLLGLLFAFAGIAAGWLWQIRTTRGRSSA
jgi:apolipoprotein N-acyltransferase